MTVRILRGPQVWGPTGKLPVSRSEFYDSFVLRDPNDPLVAGTQTKRARQVKLSGRAVGFVEEEIDDINAALVALRDATPFQPAAKRKSIPAKPARQRRQSAAHR